MSGHPVTRLVISTALAVEVLLHPAATPALALLLADLALASGCGAGRKFVGLFARLVPLSASAALLTWAFPPEPDLHPFVLGLRLLAGLGAVGLLWLTTSPRELAIGLEEKGVPAALAYLVAASFQLVPGMSRRVGLVRDALRARGADFGAGMWHRLTLLPRLLVPVVVGELLAADQRAATLMMRGFGLPGRTAWRALPEHSGEPLLRALVTLGVVADIVLRFLP